MKRLILPIFFLLFLLKLSLNGCGDNNTTIVNNNNTVPDPPVLVSPQNGSLDSLSNINFTWNSSSGATTYKIQIASDTSFTSIVLEITTTATNYVYTGVLITSSTYYWRVKGINGNGEGNFSSRWSFRTPAVVTGSIVGNWTLIYNAGTQLDICPGEMVMFPSNTGGTATLQCPENWPITRQYSVSGSTLTYTASGVQYAISFTTNNELVLTGINNNRILYYTNTLNNKWSHIENIVNSNESNSINSSD